MKLRIRGNSLRLRLSEKDLEQFARDGKVVSKTIFGTKASQQLTFSLESSSVNQIQSSFINGHIRVFLPEQQARQWISTELITLKGEQVIDDSSSLSLLIEKDLPCEH